MHKVEVSLHVDLKISEDKKVTLGNIATTIKGLGIEAKIAEQIIQAIQLVPLKFPSLNTLTILIN